MAYPSPTSIDLVSNASGLFYWLAEVTNFWFYRMLIIAIGLIVLFNLLSRDEDFIGSFAVTMFVTWGLGSLLAVIKLLPGLDWAWLTGVFIVSIILAIIFKD